MAVVVSLWLLLLISPRRRSPAGGRDREWTKEIGGHYRDIATYSFFFFLLVQQWHREMRMNQEINFSVPHTIYFASVLR